MQPELALQQLNRVRQHVDGDVEELVDALANLIALQQDFNYPMLGAKVTLWLRPPTDTYMVAVEDCPVDDWRRRFVSDDPEKWQNWDFPWYEEPDDPEAVAKIKMKQDPDDPDIVPHEAIVIEGNVAGDAPDGQLWDPNEKEYRTADDYPLGTVNVVVNDGLQSFSDDYATDVEVFTSITPANGEPAPHTYTPGWR